MDREIEPVRGVLFDFDGVLVDSGPYHYFTWAEAHRKCFGRNVPDYTGSEIVGIASRGVARRIAELSGVSNLADELYEARLEVVRTSPRVPDLAPGAVEMTGLLDSRGVPYSVISNAPTEYVRQACSRLPFSPSQVLGLEDFGDRPKPDAYPYRLGARGLGFSPDAFGSLRVIEDSPTGVAAGVAAGIPVLGLARGRDQNELYEAGASWVAEDLSAVAAAVSGGDLDAFPGFG